MSVITQTTRTLTCDAPGQPCPQQYGPFPLVAAFLRKRARVAGWAAGIVNPEPGGYPRRLDLCPVHKPAPREG